MTGWIAVCNGQRLSPGQVFRSSDGELVSDRSAGGYLRTENSYRDFVLSLEYEFPAGGKIGNSGSGVLLVGEEMINSPIRGIECQVMPGQTGDLYAFAGSHIGGVQYSRDLEVIRKLEDAERPVGEWNDYEIRCEGPTIILSLNGRIVNRATSDRPIYCQIGLMCQSSDVRLRNVRLTGISNDPTAALSPQTVISDPPLNAATFEGHSYQFFPDVESWHGAKTRCEKLGGHLATIGSRVENDFVQGLARRGIERLGKLDGVWLGATDEVRENRWEWVDGSKSSFTKWDPGQPNNKNGEEHYLLLWLSPGLWVDQPDISKQHVAYFVCEWDQSK